MSAVEPIERIRALLALYRESQYDVELPAGGIATIRVGESAPAQITEWIGASEFAAFMTACNPHSRSLNDDENEHRLDALRRQVLQHGGAFLAGAGHIPGERWRDPNEIELFLNQDIGGPANNLSGPTSRPSQPAPFLRFRPSSLPDCGPD